jgi:hypothetical protein
VCLALGLIGAGIGALMGQPNSWGWFIAGALLGAVVATSETLRRHR